MAVLNELQSGLLYHDLPPAIWPEPSHLAPMSFGGISPSIALSSPTSVPGSDGAATSNVPKGRSLPEQLHDVWDHATPGGPFWIARSLLRGIAAIGGGATGKYDIEPETPGMISETDLARLDATNAELFRRITDFASLATPRPMPTVSAFPLGVPAPPRGARVTGLGPNGPVVDGLQGRYKEALGWLRDARTGDVRGVLNHPELGDRKIDLIFGTRKSGVRHIDDDHPGTLDSLPDQWPSLAVDREGPTRTYMENSKIRAVIPKNFEGDPKDWLLTVYPKTESRPGGKLIDSATAEGRAAPFPDRSAKPNISAFLPTGNAPPWANWMPFNLVPHAALRPWSRDDDRTVQ
jgi:hypothetical protein